MALKVAAARASLQVRHGTKMGRQNIERDFLLPRVFFLMHTVAKSQFLSENSILMESTSKLNLRFFCAKYEMIQNLIFWTKILDFATVCLVMVAYIWQQPFFMTFLVKKTRLSSHFISHDFGKLTLVENETFWGEFQPQLFSKLSKLLIVMDVHSWENCIRTTKVPNTQEFRNFTSAEFFLEFCGSVDNDNFVIFSDLFSDFVSELHTTVCLYVHDYQILQCTTYLAFQ